MDDALVEKVEARLRSLLEGWFPHSTASTWPDLARAAVQAVQEAQWPHASPEDAKGGWTISPSHLQRVQAAVEAANIGYPQWEEIEAILLFQAGMPLPSFPKEGDNG